MVHEDLNPIGSNNHSISSHGSENGGAGSGRSSSTPTTKKLKQKKVPQRGLGVAQLEKIRIEEQQKKDVNFIPPTTTMSSTVSPTLPISPLPSYEHSNNNGKKLKSPVPYIPPPPPPPPPPLPPSLRSPTPTSRNHPKGSMPSFEDFQFAPVAPLNPANGGGFHIEWPTIPADRSANLSKLWPPLSQEYNPDHKLSNNHLSFPTNLSLPYETYSIASLPELLPKANGVSLVSSSSSSSVLSFPMESPSNQSFSSNYSPLWPDEEKMMVGMKRACPFPLDDPPIPIFQNGKFASIANHTLSRAAESTTCCNGGTITYNLDPVIPTLRDLPSSTSLIADRTSSRKSGRAAENGHSNGGLLSLAPPAISTPFPNVKFQDTSMLLASNNREFCNFKTLPHQVNFHDSQRNSRQGGSSNGQPNCLSFFPLPKVHSQSATPQAIHTTCNGEGGESIDLNLRL